MGEPETAPKGFQLPGIGAETEAERLFGVGSLYRFMPRIRAWEGWGLRLPCALGSVAASEKMQRSRVQTQEHVE